MAAQQPANTTLQDLCSEALHTCGLLGLGQTANAEDINRAWTHLQWMLQEWERKRWLIYHLVTLSIVSTGARTYTVGPGGDIDTGVDSVRPVKLESAFLRQLVNSQPNQVDYPLELLGSMEDYNKIALKGLSSFPGTIFLDTGWPLGTIYPWPVPQASIYSVHITVVAQLPSSFATPAAVFNLPYEYYSAMHFNLAMRLRAAYQIGSFPGDTLPMLAKNGLATLRGANTQIARLVVPDMNRSLIYNIFSDRYY